MIWQRIDEDTYIDDTLVTCAEYQLFIDEMREQGEYCQPDHWTSYQFPSGQAQDPILGVRSSDAVKFCNWLNKRDNERWGFRIPTHIEAFQYSLAFPIRTKMGYWFLNENNKIEFECIHSEVVTEDDVPLNLNRDRDLEKLNEVEIVASFLGEPPINYQMFSDRILGRSPAFEGIRLVKERIK
jgi:hypothetical protein